MTDSKAVETLLDAMMKHLEHVQVQLGAFQALETLAENTVIARLQHLLALLPLFQLKAWQALCLVLTNLVVRLSYLYCVYDRAHDVARLQLCDATKRMVKLDGVKIISKSMRYHMSHDLLQERGRKLLQALPHTETVRAVLIVEVYSRGHAEVLLNV